MTEQRATSPPPWYRGGLRFECVPECGGCCSNHGDYAYVYLEGDDLQRLAAFLHMTPQEFAAAYTTLDEGQRVLRMDEPDCPFLDQARCSVYPARPTQCRTFPFWAENLRSRRAWKRLEAFCPGIDRGDVHPLAVIQSHLDLRSGD